MTPRKLAAILDVDSWIHRDTDRDRRATPSADPYADLSALAAM